MKKRGRSKKAQFNIPFGMLFSIILIIAFLAVAIYAIMFFLNIKNCSQLGLFKEDFQEEIDRAWNSQETTDIFKGNLPGNIDYVCFIDVSREGLGQWKEQYETFKKYGYSPNTNFFFYPLKKARKCKLESFEIVHLNIEKITENNNPNCFEIINSKIEMKIEKGFYDSLVSIS